VVRRRKDALAAGADSDQEDWVEEAFGNDPNLQNNNANNGDSEVLSGIQVSKTQNNKE